MDADLQDDPQEIHDLINKIESGWDCVSGWKQTRHDPWHKVYPSRVFNWMIAKLTGLNLHDHNCGLKAYRKEVFQEVQIYGEMHRFIPVLAYSKGFKVCEIPVNHRPRTSGKSKYGFERFAKGFLDLLTVYFLTGFRYRPQHLLGTIGLSLFGIGSILLAILAALWCITRMSSSLADIHLHERALFYFAILGMLLGVQLLSIGFLAELITAMQRKDTPPYSIAAKNIELHWLSQIYDEYCSTSKRAETSWANRSNLRFYTEIMHSCIAEQTSCTLLEAPRFAKSDQIGRPQLITFLLSLLS